MAVIVALPREDDPVNKYSSEKKAHMTLLYLGEGDSLNQEDVIQYIQHVAKTSLSTFGMSVKKRGPLGPNDADVLFFDDWNDKDLVAVRSFLLANDKIKTAYDSAEQFEGWTPHLTMGFPETPAKKDDREYPGFNYIGFDKIAIWFDDYEGPEFDLESDFHKMMDSSPSAAWSDEGDGEEIQHAGRTVQDVMDDMLDEERDVFDLIVGAAIDDVDLSDDDEAVVGYDLMSDEEKGILAFVVGAVTAEDYSDELKQSVMLDIADDLLEHSGVKGMKWGVRRDRKTGEDRPSSLSKSDANTHAARTEARKTVKTGKSNLGDAHKAALKSKGHRVANAILGDKTYWKRAGIILGVTAVAAGLAFSAPYLLPAAAFGTSINGVAVAGTSAASQLAVAKTFAGFALAAGRGAGIVNGVDNTVRAIRGNARVNKSYEALGNKVNQLTTSGDEKVKKLLNQNGGIGNKFLKDPKSTVKHSALEEIAGDILGPKDLEHSGVKGMKWGVRNDVASIADLRTGSGGTLVAPGGAKPSKFDVKQSAKAMGSLRGDFLRAPDSPFAAGGSVSKINDKYNAKSKLTAADEKAYNSEVGKVLTEYAKNKVPEGATAHVEIVGNDALLVIGSPKVVNDFKKTLVHAEDLPVVYKMPLTRNDLGLIVSIEDGGEIKHFEEDGEDLIHSGVKGMRWGYRRKVGPDGLVTGGVPKNPTDGGPGGSTATPKGGSADHERAIAALEKQKTQGVEFLSNQEIKDINTRIKSLDEFRKNLDPQGKSDLQKRVDELKLNQELRNLEAADRAARQSAGAKLVKGIVSTGSKTILESAAKELGIFSRGYIDEMVGNTQKAEAKKAAEETKARIAKEREEIRKVMREEAQARRADAREAQKRSQMEYERRQRMAYDDARDRSKNPQDYARKGKRNSDGVYVL